MSLVSLLKMSVGLVTMVGSLGIYAQSIALPEQLPELERPSDAQLTSLSQSAGLQVGQSVPDFSALNTLGEPISGANLQKQGPLLVIFYRGGWCPYCNRQIRELTQAYPEFKQRGVTPVLISADKFEAAALAQQTYKIPFPVLSDAKLSAHDAFKVTMELPEALIEVYKDYGIILEDWNGAGHKKFALSSAFLVNADGVVDWANISPDYKTRPSVKQLLQAIDGQ